MEENQHKNKKPYTRTVALFVFAFWICLILTGSLIWGAANFGAIAMEEIVFTLSMSLDGSGSGFINSYISRILIPSLLILIAAEAIVFAVKFIITKKAEKAGQSAEQTPEEEKKSAKLRRKANICMSTALIVWLVFLIFSADQTFHVFKFVKNQLERSTFIEQEYVDPNDVQLTFPDKKRNLIWIFLESGESSAQDKAHGGLFDENYIPEMTQIAEENVSFSQSDKIEGASVTTGSTWTVGGLVSQSAGIPLKVTQSNMYNRMDEFETFMPGMTNLGDVLKEQGYHNYFMIGSEAKFGGRDLLMKQHGDYQIWDYNTAIEKGKIPQDYYVWWGYEDQKLYEYAKEELTRISAQEEPFNFTMLTVDTHHVDGWKCPLCRDEFDTQYANVWACAARQLNEFINWCKEQPFYENTSIVVTGDHCSMDPNFYAQFQGKDENGVPLRKVYNAFINAAAEPVQEKNRKFTTLDMFPTALAAMGVEIEGDRLGIGTNLFSEKQTLPEEYGYDVLFKELGKKSEFYNKHLLFPDKKAARQKPAA